MRDLIYCGYDNYDECKKELQKEFPDCVIEDASDDIHGGRFSIEISDDKRKEFLIFLLGNGYYDISLDLGIMSRDEKMKKEFSELLDEVIKQKKGEDENERKS